MLTVQTTAEDRPAVSDSSAEWDRLLTGRRDVWPYQRAGWGSIVAAVFGGSFHGVRVGLPDADRGRHVYYVPVLVGGALSDAGFCNGHIGYGGILPADEGTVVAPRRQLEVLRAVEEFFGRSCLRLVVPPVPAADLPDWTSSGAPRVDCRGTALVRLADADPWESYAGSVRTAVRKGRRLGVRVEALAPDHLSVAAELIRSTQQRVGAEYQMPPELIDRVAAEGPGFTVLLGCWLGDRMISTGVFLRGGGRAAYLFNGWDREHADAGANYLLVHEAVERCRALGDQLLDLGYSHHPGLRAFKQRWGADSATVVVLPQPTTP